MQEPVADNTLFVIFEDDAFCDAAMYVGSEQYFLEAPLYMSLVPTEIADNAWSSMEAQAAFISTLNANKVDYYDPTK